MFASMLDSFTVSTPSIEFRSFRILAVTGHGIPQETVDNMFSAMEAYFSLPLKTKMKVA